MGPNLQGNLDGVYTFNKVLDWVSIPRTQARLAGRRKELRKVKRIQSRKEKVNKVEAQRKKQGVFM